MNGRGREGRGGCCDGGRGYGRGGGTCNVNELNYNNTDVHDEGQKLVQEQGQWHKSGHGRDKGGCNGTGFGCGAYH